MIAAARRDMRGIWRAFFLLAAIVAVAIIGVGLASCQPAKAPGLEEAAVSAAGPVCTLIENITGTQDNPIVESICADAPEISQIVAVVVPLIAMADKLDAGKSRETCKLIPKTSVCATPMQLHAGIVAVIHSRQARELIDGGLL